MASLGKAVSPRRCDSIAPRRVASSIQQRIVHVHVSHALITNSQSDKVVRRACAGLPEKETDEGLKRFLRQTKGGGKATDQVELRPNIVPEPMTAPLIRLTTGTMDWWARREM